MKLSVIIVNYNVKHFLEHCLHSAIKASEGLDIEIIVIDNDSKDGSDLMMAERFPNIEYHLLNENLGFSKANNIGIRKSKGEYVLLLNPDTLVAEDTFEKCIAFADVHADCGGLGIHMIDGQGVFLPESKRGLPTPKAAFFKIFGLSALFPKSNLFGKYHLGYLDEFEVNEIDVLSGAFMMMRRTALESAGLLDEEYFMYGEDIDLSYKITKAGFKNYYFPEAEIIHYKGESTKKGSVNYVFVFYKAMIIFARKHFEKGQASLFGLLINLAIYFRAFLALVSRLFGKTWQLMLDFTITASIFALVAQGYASYQSKDFSLPFISFALPSYAIIIAISLLYSEVYDKPYKVSKLFRGWITALVVLLAFYALLPEEYRFSRAVILIGATASFSFGWLWRKLLMSFSSLEKEIAPRINTRRLIVAEPNELDEINQFIADEKLPAEFSAGVLPFPNKYPPEGYLGTIDQIEKTIGVFDIHEIIFHPKSISYGQQFKIMRDLKFKKVTFTTSALDGSYFIGSQSVVRSTGIKELGLLRNLNLSAIYRNKRTFDLLSSLFLLPLSPFLTWLVDDKLQFLKNLLSVLVGNKSWIGLDSRANSTDFPKMKVGVISPYEHVIFNEEAHDQVSKENANYLLKHTILLDMRILVKHFQFLGNER